MTLLTIKVVNAELVRKGLQDLTDEIPRIGREQIWNAVNKIKARMQVYPPERPGQKYIRTYTLRGGWTVQPVGDIRYRVSNDVTYTPRVVGNAWGLGQGQYFVGRWQLFRDVADEEVNALPPEVEKFLSMAARRYLP